MSTWDLTALVNAADPRSPLAERHLWLVRLTEWLRHAPAPREDERTPLPLLKLRLLLNLLDGHPAIRERVVGLLERFWQEIDAAALYADFGFGARLSLASEVRRRLALKLLPGTPQTRDLAALFQLLFDPADAAWLDAIDEPTLERIAHLIAPPGGAWRLAMLDAVTMLASAVQAGGYAAPLRARMDSALLADDPFRQLGSAAEHMRSAATDAAGNPLQAAQVLRAVLDACHRAGASVTGHLEEFGISVDIVFELDQMRRRIERIETLIACVVSPQPLPELRHLVVQLLQAADEQRGFSALLGRHYSLLARQVAERSAEAGAHYIATDGASYRDLLRRAAGGGLVLAGTTYLKFGVVALGMTAFWTGFASGLNYAASFLIVMLLHCTVATKQPAMTAPAMAAALAGRRDDAEVEAFVDRVAQLIRSQAAGIFGNLAACAPLALAVQWGCEAAFGRPLVGEPQAQHVLHSLTLLGPTAIYAAFTGVLLFASSLIAGWAENRFVFQRLDSAIAWNPRFLATLGPQRAASWARWWRANVSGVAANVSLGFMLGLVPAVASFLALPIDVRHVTLSTGQLAAAAGAIGVGVLREPDFWWCVAGIAVTGVLNVTVSFALALKVALRSRGIQVKERERIQAAIRHRLWHAPSSFVLPPRGT